MKFLGAGFLMVVLSVLSCPLSFAASLSQYEAENLVNEAMQSMDKDPMRAVKNFEQVLAAYPDNGPTYYYCALLMGSLGEPNAAKLFYRKAIEYGYRGDPIRGDIVGGLLKQYEPREFDIEYPSIKGGSRKVHIKGNPGGDEELIRDALKQIERMGPVWGIAEVHEVSVTFLRWINSDILYEQWTIPGGEKSVDVWVTYETNLPPGSATRSQIMIADQDDHPAREELKELLKFVSQ